MSLSGRQDLLQMDQVQGTFILHLSLRRAADMRRRVHRKHYAIYLHTHTLDQRTARETQGKLATAENSKISEKKAYSSR
ncbi:hypothetical protein [Xanthomonas fragariae]|uniref:hypothetical protein n=2 Tax=Xanthomonas fragariae TaxID=48664 RepID=UPI000B4303FD|nr:hypothetical protein [Xanthomonas fragariae]MDM7558293.1 hypothetical protein [Xanthomonas fragariae]MDM7571031.1 hypothetical protein [Xanthomonas fragariae]MDM7575987.1 hypothetical protein [Xanthomonas fragariae]MDM7580313.1 hypothetical protein [Xanthomonas fragariae]MEA5172543.1 hypothetical protein [Xanthomonas fragariae]